MSTLAVCNGVLYSGSWDGTVRLWCLSDHSPLTVLGENSLGTVTSVLSLAADQHVLIAAHENGHLKVSCTSFSSALHANLHELQRHYFICQIMILTNY